ncbi:hypothetical protein [Secundilactobacillus malefermentans]|uniref:Phage tail protein n=1 Tax=Secundilactobacillus malefermentans TaxID=176292 RepID=A0A4R5NP34_9LACO|nr:hypothetical protein [Secundilactobacillus malefermentans]KRM57916.1 hypothetical protein FD44_GL000945 [Secundilactobacillus malefermentans DSM 5705 = KCTC 3548]QEA31486.1 phage tail protein [Secundilactobacillus malefermentans]TDG78364.1 hypothetical protein C5L31_000115 [Secundilactobacillus malefermentans]
MAYKVDFKNVATIGLGSSPVAEKLAGMRAHEARYFWNKFKHEFITVPAADDPDTLAWIESICQERDLVFPYQPLEVTSFEAGGNRYACVFYENGLAVNVLYGLEEGAKRAVGFKLSDGMEIPAEFEGKFKFAKQRSTLAGTIRGTFFIIKGTYL